MSKRSNSPKTPPPKLLPEIDSNDDKKKSSFSSINSRTNRRRTGSGSKSPPTLEPKLNHNLKKQFIPVPQKQHQPQPQPQPIIKKATVEQQTLIDTDSLTSYENKPITAHKTQQSNRQYTLKTSLEKPTQCTLCNIYIMRPYVLTSCCNKPYHPDCLSMLYTETLSFDVKNGTTFSQIYLNHECGFSNRDEEGRNYNGLTKLFKYFELGIKNCINV